MHLTRTIAIPLAFTLVVAAHGRESVGQQAGAKGNNGEAKAAGCSPSTAITELDLNNVRTRVETGGNMWQNRAQGLPAYEVPKTEDRSGPSALFAGALWMGGFSPDNQLKLAAVRFRQNGNDYWPGPLTNTGDASIDEATCIAYDKTWKTKRQDAARHYAFYQCQDDPDCDLADEFPDGYVTPSVFFDWPAEGNVDAGQDPYLAPFFDFDQDGAYDPTKGDFPGYDLDGNIDCASRFRTDPVPLFGDENIFWIFNDKGNTHTESGGQPIGMEIRAQAFAFSTNDEVNNMTFYNYVVINQGTQTLLNTYFGQWVDCDLGNAQDDFVGCDVQRGLGYCYNGDPNDEDSQSPGYGLQPPAIGVDFFEGPFVDEDGLDNPLTLDCAFARANGGIPYKGIGIGYGDSIPDNERFGMRAFLYHNNNGDPNTGDPSNAIQYYNFLRAVWKDNSPNVYGGTGHISSPGADPNTPASYMFPGVSDPVGWGTNCVPQPEWTEETSNNAPFDRRFIQSAGPFTLLPGDFNNITVGVVWARATGGGPYESVNSVRRADDKAQSLFDNCFKILNGPDAPNLAIQELDRQLLIYIEPAGNNINEQYLELDPTIPDSASDRFYRFQGYQLYQVKNADVDVSQLSDVNFARLVFQCDIEDGVGQLVNYIQNTQINLPVPTEMVNGADQGISHSLAVTEDLFSTSSDQRLVNFKSYYYICLAYGYNEYEPYNPSTLSGQPFPYKAGRKAAAGSIRSYVGIPHKPSPELGGTTQNSSYGDQLPITRLEGQGNGGLPLDMEEVTANNIIASPIGRVDELRYKRSFGPLSVKVIDPLNVPQANFELWFLDSTATTTPDDLNDARWKIVNLDSATTGGRGTIYSDRTIAVRNEQLIPDWGISVTVTQSQYEGCFTDFLGASITYTGDPWFTGIPDGEGQNAFNWIRSGTSNEDGNSYNDYANTTSCGGEGFRDEEEVYEGVLGGTWAPFTLVGDTAYQPAGDDAVGGLNIARINQTTSSLIVITPDKSKWTRCAVIENEENVALAQGGARKMGLRAAPSVDKNGRPTGSPGCNEDEATLFGAQPTGMGWFPGYAIDLETGERQNMAFSENSFFGGIGRDMIWNPSEELTTSLGQVVFGGCHWIYTFRNQQRTDITNQSAQMPQYDEGRYFYNNIGGGTAGRTRIYKAVNWVGSAMLAPGYSLVSPENGLVPSEVRIVLDVNKPYAAYVDPYGGYQPPIVPQRNNGLGLYTFSTNGLATMTDQQEVAESSCDLMNVVPNPYYAYSGYETGRLDNRVKFTNLPQTCTISIYNVSGTLVRKYRKDNELTYLDWDLRNQANVPIAGGVYICHIDVPGVCEKVIKWFGVMRPVDLQNF